MVQALETNSKRCEYSIGPYIDFEAIDTEFNYIFGLDNGDRGRCHQFRLVIEQLLGYLPKNRLPKSAYVRHGFSLQTSKDDDQTRVSTRIALWALLPREKSTQIHLCRSARNRWDYSCVKLEAGSGSWVLPMKSCTRLMALGEGALQWLEFEKCATEQDALDELNGEFDSTKRLYLWEQNLIQENQIWERQREEYRRAEFGWNSRAYQS